MDNCPDKHRLLAHWQGLEKTLPAAIPPEIRMAMCGVYFTGAGALYNLLSEEMERHEEPVEAFMASRHVLAHAVEDIESQVAGAKASAVIAIAKMGR